MLGQKIVAKKDGIGRTHFLYSVFVTLGIAFSTTPPLFAFDLPPLDSSNGIMITGEAVNGQLGGADKAMSAIGDINGDGIDDFALSANNFNHFYTAFVTDPLTGDVIEDIDTKIPLTKEVLTRNSGRVYVIFGRDLSNPFTSNFDVTKLISGDSNGNAEQGFVVTTASGSELVSSLSGNCDVNGDGHPDLIIGAPRSLAVRPTTSIPAGEVYVIYGHNANEPFKADISVESLRDGSGGRRDGGLCRSDGKSCPGDGSGSFGIVIKGSAKSDEAGKSVTCLKDINGDGIDDVFIGTGISNTEATSIAFQQGKAYVMYGSRSLPAVFDVQNLEAVGADGSSGFQISAATFVTKINPTDPPPNPMPGELPAPPVPVKDDFSKFSANAGDMNGDGINDFIIAAPSASPMGNAVNDGKYQSGQTYVIFGRQGNYPSTLNISDLLNGNGSMGFAINGMCARDKSGLAVSSAGDINNDGLADIIIGTNIINLDFRPENVNRDCGAVVDQRYIISGAGQSYIILGRAPSISGNFPATLELLDLQAGDGSNGMIINGATPGASGFSVAGLGDFNADGFDDVAIAAPVHNRGEGAVYIMRGRDKTQPFPAIISLASFEDNINDYGFIIHGAGLDEKAGSLIAYAGDINNDSYPDILIGVPDANTSNIIKIKTGEVFVVYGASDIDQREVRPESHKGGTPNKTPSADTGLPQNGVGHLWWLIVILALGQTYRRLRA